MKYESNILERLIKTYGVVGNPKYVSEIIKQFIIQGKECYPNLFTYQSDWLAHIDEFGLENDYVVTYTGQHFYAPNTKGSPVKRAILKGSTKYCDIDTGEFLETFEEGRNLELVSVRMPVLTTYDSKSVTNIPIEFFEESTPVSVAGYSMYVYETDNNFKMFATLNEYLDGDNDVRIAVRQKNGVITAKNLSVGVEEIIELSRVTYFGFYSEKMKPLGGSNPQKSNILEYIKSGKLNLRFEIYNEKFYPPYNVKNANKSNILTVNEDVELRGIGGVSDELDCLTGEVTERIGEIVLDGSENWKAMITVNGTYRYATTDKTTNVLSPSHDNELVNALSNRLPITTGSSSWNNVVGLCNHVNSGWVIYDGINTDLNSFKEWISQNPITIQFQLATESIKTVDLTILDQNGQSVDHLKSFNGGTHFDTSSQDGSLLPTLTVDVVTDLEETLAVCSLEGNTM